MIATFHEEKTEPGVTTGPKRYARRRDGLLSLDGEAPSLFMG